MEGNGRFVMGLTCPGKGEVFVVGIWIDSCFISSIRIVLYVLLRRRTTQTATTIVTAATANPTPMTTNGYIGAVHVASVSAAGLPSALVLTVRKQTPVVEQYGLFAGHKFTCTEHG